MARQDYYLILGVSRREKVRGIQEAFSELAKIYHPKGAGHEANRKFKPIGEAYTILSDPVKRRLYGHEVENEEAGRHSTPEPTFSQ